MAILIADTAWVDPRAQLEDGVQIGPFCIIGPNVRIGRDTHLLGHVCIQSQVTLGQRNRVSPFSVLGGDPPDPDSQSPQGSLEIGDDNQIRESVVIARSRHAAQPTRIGSRNILQAGSHIAASCHLADHISVGNHSVIGHSVQIASNSVVGPTVTVHHFVTIGEASFVAAQSRIFHDVPPYMIVDGQPARVRCLHTVGLKKLGLDRRAFESLHEAHRLLFRARMAPAQAAQVLADHGQQTPQSNHLLAFIRDQQSGRHGRGREQAHESTSPTHSPRRKPRQPQIESR